MYLKRKFCTKKKTHKQIKNTNKLGKICETCITEQRFTLQKMYRKSRLEKWSKLHEKILNHAFSKKNENYN